MKKIMLLSCMLIGSSVYAQSEADKETLIELMEYCQEVADEDGTGEMSLDKFLLNCINEELESEGYLPIKTLPTP